MKFLLRFAVLCGIALALLHFLTPARVYSNDSRMIVPALGLALLSALASVRSRAVPFYLLAMIGALTWSVTAVRDGRMSDRVVSCANHSGQWSAQLRRRIRDAKAEDRLPSAAEFEQILSEPGMSCPGRGDSCERTGYVFVGGGLSVELVLRERPLIAFCAAGCHPSPWDHEHALVGDWLECVSGPELGRKIQRALEQVRDGRVPYGPDAVAALERELAARSRP